MDPTIEQPMIGELADDWLSSGQRAVVIAAISRAVYLNTGKDELYWIAKKNSPMHRRCLQISTPLPRLTVGSILDVRDRMLEIPSWGALDFQQPVIWKAPILLSEELIPPGKLAEHALLFYHQFLHGNQPVGLGCLLPAILQNLAHGSPHLEFGRENIFLSTAWPVVEHTISLLLTHDSPSLPQTALELVGLGEGLTPSGDDFLGGLLFGIHLLQKTYPSTLGNFWNYAAFIEQCKPRTNRISFTLLKDHADGHTLEPLHKFACALLQGQSVDQMLPSTEELLNVGHSTGWDLLTGFMVGTTVVFSR